MDSCSAGVNELEGGWIFEEQISIRASVRLGSNDIGSYQKTFVTPQSCFGKLVIIERMPSVSLAHPFSSSKQRTVETESGALFSRVGRVT